MKNDYLWDKTGEDPEIERLENALSAFRYQETAPPVITAKVAPFSAINREKTPRRKFSLALPFAFAACAALFLILFGVRFQNFKDNSAKTIAPQTDDTIQKDLIAAQSQIVLNENIEIIENVKNHKSSKRFAAQNAIKVSRRIPVNSRQNKTIAKNSEIIISSTTLTTEEKKAYDQLMLALSITGSKLKIVRDKIDGIEVQNEENVDPKDGR